MAYRRSPQCTSSLLAKYQSKGKPVNTTEGIWTLTVDDGKTETFEIPWTYQLNENDKRTLYLTLEGPTSTVFNAPNRFDYQQSLRGCCGKCFLTVSSVDVFYWKTATSSDKPLITSAPRYAPNSIVQDGYTFISPSVYLSYGMVQAFDNCGNHGPSFESIMVPLDPEDLSTVNNLNGRTAERNRVRLNDLSCEPNTYVITTSGSKVVTSWCSIFLAPVSKLYDLDSSFKNCHIQNGGYDPYFALTTKPPLAPPVVETTRSAEESTTLSTFVPIAMPEQPRPGPGPEETLPPTVPQNLSPTSATKPSKPSKPHQNLDDHGHASSDPQPNGQDPPRPTLVVSRKVLVGSKSVYMVGSQTLKDSGPAITVSGAVVSLDTSASMIVVGEPKSKKPQATPAPSLGNLSPYTTESPSPYPSQDIGGVIFSVWNGPSATVTADATVSYWNGTIIQAGGSNRNSRQTWHLLLVVASTLLWFCI